MKAGNGGGMLFGLGGARKDGVGMFGADGEGGSELGEIVGLVGIRRSGEWTGEGVR